MFALKSDLFAFIKPSLDAHTLGIYSAAELLRSCGYRVIIGDEMLSGKMNDLKYEANRTFVINWLLEKNVSRIGLSYRLDEKDAVQMVGCFMHSLESKHLLSYQGGPVKAVYFAGLPGACEAIETEHKGFVKTFTGGETVRESLIKMDVPAERIPKDIMEGSLYDDLRMEFGKEIIKSEAYASFIPYKRSDYKEY